MVDEQEEELLALMSIFPELVINPLDRHIRLYINVATPQPVAVTLLGTDDGLNNTCTRSLSRFPPLKLDVTLPRAYPEQEPPHISLSTTPAWLSADKLTELGQECTQLWDEYGRCQILYTCVDHLQQSAERLFDITDLALSDALCQPMLDFDRVTRKQEFEEGTYDCGVCLEPKKGIACHRMASCGHVFCKPCLNDFYNAAVSEGDVTTVACLEPTCGKQDKKPAARKKSLHPRELLDIGINEAQTRRYVEMKRKKKLESDKSTIYCPRTWCQAPARSNKYPPIPADLTQYHDSDDSGDESTGPRIVFSKDTPEKQLPPPADRLAICSKCSLAFCRVCYLGWHGEFARCWPRNPGELSVEERASYDYIKLHTSPCPSCASPTQKTMGCNHMRCFQCNAHFCYLCSAWLPPDNPYQHFNTKQSSCYMRLWELEEGEEGLLNGEDARRREAEARAIAAAADEEEMAALGGAAQNLLVVQEVHLDDETVDGDDRVLNEDEHHPAENGLYDHDDDERHGFAAIAADEDLVQHPLLRFEDLPREERAAGPAEDLRQAQPAPPVVPPQAPNNHGRRRRRQHRGGPGHNGAVQGHEAGQQALPAPHDPRGLPIRRANPAGPNAPRNRHALEQARAREDRNQQQEALLRFVEMAQRDEEDQWDSDELEDDEHFRIR